MKIKKIIFPLLISSMAFSCSREYIKPISVKRNFSGALWVVRHNISTPEKIDTLLRLIEDTNIKNLIVQVRGRGDSYYDSYIEPPAFDVPQGFDPLKYLLEKTEKSDIKIHAWINVSFVLNADAYPPDKRHILSRHPEWVTYDYNGKPMTDYTQKDLSRNLLEGYFLDPGVPEVKDHIVQIVEDVINKYKIDGIHLDFIRYPYSGYNSYYGRNLSDFGYNPVVRRIFKQKYGFDPLKIDRTKSSYEKEIFDQFRRDQVTEIVKRISSVVRASDSRVILSAAVMPRYDRGKNVYFQDWPFWLGNNYLDIACVMSYSASISGFNSYIDYADNTSFRERIYMGISVMKNTPLKKAVEQIGITYNKGMRGYAIFSFHHDKKFIDELDSLIRYGRHSYKF